MLVVLEGYMLQLHLVQQQQQQRRSTRHRNVESDDIKGLIFKYLYVFMGHRRQSDNRQIEFQLILTQVCCEAFDVFVNILGRYTAAKGAGNKLMQELA